MPGPPLRKLLELVQEAAALVDSCCKPGARAPLLATVLYIRKIRLACHAGI